MRWSTKAVIAVIILIIGTAASILMPQVIVPTDEATAVAFVSSPTSIASPTLDPEPPTTTSTALPTSTETSTATDAETASSTPTDLPTLTFTATLLPTRTQTPSNTPIRDLGIITATPLPTFTLSLVEATPLDPPPPSIGIVEATAASSSATISHVVRDGDTLNKIARQYGITPEEIATLNGITNPDSIYTGQVLLIPISTELAAQMTGTYIALLPTATATPSNTPTPPRRSVERLVTATPLPTSTITPTASSTPEPPTDINGVPLMSMLVMDTAVRKTVRDIYACGILLDNNPRAFSKVGDSKFESPYFLGTFDTNQFNLGDYSYLQSTVDYFSGSFARASITVKKGFHSWSAFDPMWADKAQCGPNEGALACEYRLQRPSLALIQLGTNDWGTPELYEKNMRRVIEFSMVRGVVPVISTKVDRVEGAGNYINGIIRKLATEYKIPLWDMDTLASSLPSRGVDQDGIHLTVYTSYDYRQAAAFSRGYGVQNLSALLVLRSVVQTAQSGSGNAILNCGME
ncbi:MAG: LysM peptidoglycan-binding domain-containing protein [Anaerolineae bacterium]|nr:LysM peptidoglycan-binding domain-containing protein [Anaerolineae bacterium]